MVVGKAQVVNAADKLPNEPFTLTSVWSPTRATDAGLASLVGLADLKSVDLSATAVTDAGLKHLAGLTSLHDLIVTNAEVSDAGLAHLAG
jgi:hypothetical protein